MRIFAMAAALFAVMVLVVPAHAQDIIGLGLHATEAMPDGTASGSVDIMKEGSEYEIAVDMTAAGDALNLDDYDDAEGFVVWAVDTAGNRYNLGTLGDDSTLTHTATGYMVARLYITAEPDAGVANPTGDRLFEVTLRAVEERTAEESESSDADEEGDEDEATEDEGAEDEEGEEEGAEDGGSPNELPTTGSLMRDLLVLLAVAGALMVGAVQLKRIRI